MFLPDENISKIELIRKFAKKVDTTGICDADKSIRVMSTAIKCRSQNPFICGYAFTVQCRDDFFPVIRAIESASINDVIIVDGGEKEIAYAGELFARTALVRNLSGIIIDGGYRDINYVSKCNLPVYSRYITPKAGTTNQLGKLQITVTCGNAAINPGDIIIADKEGIVILDPSKAIQILEAAIKIKTTENKVIQELNKGNTLSDCLNVDEHTNHLKQGKISKLRFTV